MYSLSASLSPSSLPPSCPPSLSVCVCMGVCVRTHMPVYAWRPKKDFTFPTSLRQSLSLNPVQSTLPQESCLPAPLSGYRHVLGHTQLFTWVLGSALRSSYLHLNSLYPLGRLSSSKNYCLIPTFILASLISITITSYSNWNLSSNSTQRLAFNI